MAEKLRPGFKAEAENIAQLVRGELGLGPLDALDCFALAEKWGIPVVSLGELRENGATDRSVRRLLSEDAGVLGDDGRARHEAPDRLQPAPTTRPQREQPGARAFAPDPRARGRSGHRHRRLPALGRRVRRPKPTGSAQRCSCRARALSSGCSRTATSKTARETSASASSCSGGASTTPASSVSSRASARSTCRLDLEEHTVPEVSCT